MNIFWLHWHVARCAEAHGDKHVVKMILELAQPLCTAISVCDYGGEQIPRSHFPNHTIPKTYRKTHPNHPCAVVVRQCPAVYRKVSQLLLALCAEYTRRYGRTHATEALARGLHEHPPQNFRPDEQYANKDVCIGMLGKLKAPLCMPQKYWTKSTNGAGKYCARASYRRYYIGDKFKAGIVKYKHSSPPAWLETDH